MSVKEHSSVESSLCKVIYLRNSSSVGMHQADWPTAPWWVMCDSLACVTDSWQQPADQPSYEVTYLHAYAVVSQAYNPLLARIKFSQLQRLHPIAVALQFYRQDQQSTV